MELRFSGSYDSTIFVWDIGGRKGTVYELHGHRQKVTFVRYLATSKQLMSAGEDGNLVLWDMSTPRIEVRNNLIKHILSKIQLQNNIKLVSKIF